MSHRVEVAYKPDLLDPEGLKTRSRILHDLQIEVEDVRCADAYIIDREFNPAELQYIAQEVFFDPVLHVMSLDQSIEAPFDWLIEVGYKPGVTDNIGRTARECIERVINSKFDKWQGVYTRKLYFIRGVLTREQVDTIAGDLLANDLIQTRSVFRSNEDRSGAFAPRVTSKSAAVIRPVNLNVDDDELMRISREGILALSLEEMKIIRNYYRNANFLSLRRKNGLNEMITDCELEVLAQTWSEHCKHKIFNAIIEYSDETGVEQINSLFKTYVQGSTEKIRSELGNSDFCLSVFKDNAGVIKFNEDWNLAVKVETHNSPSALDPYGGALTGIVGVNRDPLGAGLGSRLIFNTDVFCFAAPNYRGKIPARLLHPKRVFEGVREGVEHGGNKSGIPTVNGAVVFDDRYLGKPLVYCGTGGIMPALINGKPSHEKKADPSDRIVMVGGRIGKDGIHGATFSSEELHEGSPAAAVQIGDPITQKRMTDFLLVARDKGLYSSITDNGAGGLSSSVGEMACESGGATLRLDRAPLKYAGLQPWEILLSEAQERMTVAVPIHNIDEFLGLAKEMDVEATDLGEFTDDGLFIVMWGEKTAALLPLSFLHEGLPQMRLRAKWRPPIQEQPQLSDSQDLTGMLLKLMGRWNVCSKEKLIRQYDHEVQAATIIKPLVGATNDGPGDASVLRPIYNEQTGLAVGCGILPRYSDIDTYWMMAAVIDEAVRNIIAVGANPDHMAGLDNFCWCDPVQSEKTPDGEYKLAQLVRANKALYDITTAYRIPCISGKDSMKNDYNIGNSKISIPPTVLFTAIGIVPDAAQAVTADFKSSGDLIYVLGITRNETGASEYFAELGYIGTDVPKVTDPAKAIAMYRALHQAIRSGLIKSCHDISDGGLAVSLAECCFSGGLGAIISLDALPRQDVHRDDAALFSESTSRFVISIAPEEKLEFEAALEGFPLAQIGKTVDNAKLEIKGLKGGAIVSADILDLKEKWQAPLGF